MLVVSDKHQRQELVQNSKKWRQGEIPTVRVKRYFIATEAVNILRRK